MIWNTLPLIPYLLICFLFPIKFKMASKIILYNQLKDIKQIKTLVQRENKSREKNKVKPEVRLTHTKHTWQAEVGQNGGS